MILIFLNFGVSGNSQVAIRDAYCENNKKNFRA